MAKTDAEKMTTLFEFSATSAKIMAISGVIPASLGQNRPISSINRPIFEINEFYKNSRQ